jgi:lipid-binding SYLF domain-containing protein
MQIRARLLSIIGAVSLVVSLAGCGTTPPTRTDTTQQVRAAQTVLDNFKNDPEMTWFRAHVKDARAILISPQVTRAGFVVGGSGGEAVALARGTGGRWLGPAFYNMGAGSVGFMAGLDVSEVVVLVLTEKALNGLLSASFKLGGDASITAGPVGVGAAATVTTDMVSFARSKGVYAGVSLDGLVISPDSDANAAYYGKPASPVDIFVRGTVTNTTAAPLQKSLSDMAR